MTALIFYAQCFGRGRFQVIRYLAGDEQVELDFLTNAVIADQLAKQMTMLGK